MTGKAINLRQRRKQRQRDADRTKADENAARHGQSRARRDLAAARAEKEQRDLDGHRRDDDQS